MDDNAKSGSSSAPDIRRRKQLVVVGTLLVAGLAIVVAGIVVSIGRRGNSPTPTSSVSDVSTPSRKGADDRVSPPPANQEQPPVDAGATTRFRISTRGFGPVVVGMTADQASAALGVRLVLDAPNENCRYAAPASGFPGVSFMMISGRVARVDVANPSYATPSGARVGATEQQVQALYPGRINVSPHAYDDRGHYLTFMPKDASEQRFRIVFETDGAQVTGIRAGRLPEVEYVEGCM